jgi:UDP-glucose 4-epimerase
MAPRPTSPYGASKLMLEGYLSAFAASYGVSGCALRFSNIYGTRSLHKGSVVAHFYKQMLDGKPLVVYGDGSQARDYLYAGDLVEAIEAAMNSDKSGAFQLGSGKATTINELIDVIRTVTGQDPEVQYKDFRAGEIRNTWCQVDKARAELGFDPKTPLEQGMRETWEWFQAQSRA